MTPPDAIATRPVPNLPAATVAVADLGSISDAAADQPEPMRGPATGGLRAYLSKYLAIFRVSFAERMTYRVDFLLGTVLRFLPMVTTILLWQAIFTGSKKTELAGFTYREMIAYLLLTNISRMFSSMPGLAGGVAREIREGTMKRYLLQPIDMIGYLVSYRIAHKITYIITAFVPYAILFFVCRGFFDGFPDASTLAAFAASLILAFVVGFFFEACVGMVGFWFLEVTSLLYIVMTLNFFISGHMLPLDLLPQPWRGLLMILPFQYMAYFPAVVFLGKVKGTELVLYLLGGVVWSVFFIVLTRVLYRLGVRRYSAFGG